MPVVAICVGSRNLKIEISEKRQGDIKAALMNANHPDWEREVRLAIQGMGMRDRLTDLIFRGGAKEEALRLLADKVISDYASNCGRTPNNDDCLAAFDALFNLLSEQGMQSLLMHSEEANGHMYFHPKTGTDLDLLLGVSLPYGLAGGYLEQAGMLRDAATAYGKAANRAMENLEFVDAAKFFGKEEACWKRVRGESLSARQAWQNSVSAYRRAAALEVDKENFVLAAACFSGLSRMWGRANGFGAEKADALGMSATCWQLAADKLADTARTGAEWEKARQLRKNAEVMQSRKVAFEASLTPVPNS